MGKCAPWTRCYGPQNSYTPSLPRVLAGSPLAVWDCSCLAGQALRDRKHLPGPPSSSVAWSQVNLLPQLIALTVRIVPEKHVYYFDAIKSGNCYLISVFAIFGGALCGCLGDLPNIIYPVEINKMCIASVTLHPHLLIFFCILSLLGVRSPQRDHYR